MYKTVNKAVILAGGKGTRLAEETSVKPKPMVEIGGKPILWHIMKIYSQYGINEFVICLGYKGQMIKEYFLNYALLNSDITVHTHADNSAEFTIHKKVCEDWKITLADTGEDTMTGGRLKRVKPYLSADEPFCLTYGDGVSDINIHKLIDFHLSHGKLATVSGVRPLARFGALHMEDGLVTRFQEKPDNEGGYINGGFFVLSPKVIDYIKNDETLWEKEPLEQLASGKQLLAYLHDGFWQPMDTLRDRYNLEEMWEKNKAPWKSW
jgi:glucose-1-phosphate cytidylyltransferase